MADTFFGFDASVNNGDHLLPPEDDDCVENEEEEYDALNDETFGALEDSSCLEDWEQQHEEYAEYAACSKQSEQIENSLSRLVLDEPEPISSLSKNNVWAYTPPNRNGDILNSSLILSSLEKASKSFIETRIDSNRIGEPPRGFAPLLPTLQPRIDHVPKQICTVEELEKNLIKTSKNVVHPPGGKPMGGPPYPHPMFQMPHGRLPPGLPPLGMPPPMRQPPPNFRPLPPGLMHMHHMPFMPQRAPPGLMYPPHHNAQFPVNHPYNFPPPRNLPPPMMNNMNNRQMGGMMQQQMQVNPGRVRNDSYNRNNNNRSSLSEEMKDEYAGLMSNREKQWLLNIQLLQLNTGTPYFDDYYYTVFKERQSKVGSESNYYFSNDRRFPPSNKRNNNNHQEGGNNTLTPKVYTPLQFENSLGKLQCGSVTAPRKIIDMDIVTPDKDSDTPVVIVRDTRKTKQLLLELEVMYSLLLKAEDLRNPLAISNLEKLREIKQKQRLRELELAPTPEQKQQVLGLLKSDSEPVVENQHEFIVRIVNGFLQEEKFASFLNIRKGKMLLLRLLPHLTPDMFGAHLLDLWSRVLLSISIIGRRDTSGDHILPKLHPFFKRFIQTCNMGDILDLVTGLVEVARLENSRSTPLSHQGKTPLYFVLLNKFGVSALVTLFIRSEYLISSDSGSEKQQNDWSNFLVSWMDLTRSAALGKVKIAMPTELIPLQIFEKHLLRFKDFISHDQLLAFQRFFVDLNL